MQTLTFQNITLTPVSYNDAQIWLSSSDLAKALGYADVRSIANIYNRNKEEFTSGMTTVIKLITNGINGSERELETRIFNLRGCHLIAMFARTAVAKEFRKWVLDILDKEVGTPVQRHTISVEQQAQIRHAIAKRCKSNREHYQSVYTALHQEFNIPRYSELLAVDFERAMAFIEKFCQSNFNFVLNCTSDSLFQNSMAQAQLNNLISLLQPMVGYVGELQRRLKQQEQLLRASQKMLK